MNYDDLVRRLDAIVNGDGPKPPWSIAGLTSIVTPSGDMFLTSDRGDHTNDWTRQKVCDAINLAGQAAAAIQELQRDARRLDFIDDCVMNRGKCFSADRDYEGRVDLPTHGYLPTITLFTVPSQHVKGIGLRAAIDEAMQHEGG